MRLPAAKKEAGKIVAGVKNPRLARWSPGRISSHRPGKRPFRISREIIVIWTAAALLLLFLLIGYGGAKDGSAPGHDAPGPAARAFYWLLPGIRRPPPGGDLFEKGPSDGALEVEADDGAVPAFGSVSPESWEAGSSPPPDTDDSVGPDLSGTDGQGLISRWLRGMSGMSGLKHALRTAVPGLAAVDPPESPWASDALTPGYLLVTFFEGAGGVAIGQPWTLLASELPALGMMELPEQNVPLVIDPSLLAPDGYFFESLEPGQGGGTGAGASISPPHSNGIGEAIEPGQNGLSGGQNVLPGEDGLAGSGGPPMGTADEPGHGVGGGEPIPSAPAVFIYHSHGTEAFLGAIPAGAGVNPNVSGFSADPSRSIIRVGDEVQGILEDEYGIGVIHAADLFDWQEGRVTRIGSYYRSLQMLENFRGSGRSIIEEHPSLRVVIDLHRDAIPRKMSVTDVGGETVARLLFIVGTRHHGHPGWETNLCFATVLHELAEERYPGISRGVMQRPGDRFNQHILPGALLIEVGSVENTLDEALRSARIVAELVHGAISGGLVPEAGEPYRCPAKSINP